MGERELDLLWRYYRLITARNLDHGLTRLEGLKAIATKHFLDCAVVADLVDLPSPLLDIGTGAGFPGVVLKILRSDLSVILAEERPLKATFLREVVTELDLADVEILAGRVTAATSISAAGVITRAVESAAATLTRCRTFLDPGGLVILMKGPSATGEVRDAARQCGGSFVLQRDLAYVLTGTPYRRRILVYERTAAE